ncbi:MAG: hypothetical protein PHS45_03435 [Bacilli bacterium]|nr:hypothetical protein [Bacilli bacterium]
MITVDLINKYRSFKNKYTHSLIIIKSSCFFMVFNNDAKIIAHLFNYKIRHISNHSIVYIHPRELNTVKMKLKESKLAFIVISTNSTYISRKNKFTNKNYERIINEEYDSSAMMETINYLMIT